MEHKRKFGIYTAWNYDKEEDKINSMAIKGWQLKKGGSFHHTYERSKINYRYKLDFNTNAKFNNEEYRRYLTFYEDQGWELINSTFNGWFYFRKPYEEGLSEEEYEIYTDNDSLKDMLSRWISIARILQIFFLILLISNLVHFVIEKRTFNGLTVLSVFFGILFFQTGITSMKRKSVQIDYRSSRSNNFIATLLFFGMFISYVLMFVFPSQHVFCYDYELSYSESINKDTDNRVEPMTVDKDGLYSLDIKCKNERGLVGIKILKDDTIVYNTSGGNYTITTNLELEKGDYQIEVQYYLENLEGAHPMPITQELLEQLNLTGDLEEYSDVRVFVGIR